LVGREEGVFGRELVRGEAELVVVDGAEDVEVTGFGEHEGVVPASGSVGHGFRNIYFFGLRLSRASPHLLSLSQLPKRVVSPNPERSSLGDRHRVEASRPYPRDFFFGGEFDELRGVVGFVVRSSELTVVVPSPPQEKGIGGEGEGVVGPTGEGGEGDVGRKGERR
jgi:hypothetical protein